MNKKYQIIYADPPWKYDNERNNDPKQGGKTYPAMKLEDIKKLPISDITNKDCFLFLWATMPKLPEAFEVIKAWGFKYITCPFVWVKLNPTGKIMYHRKLEKFEYGYKIYDIYNGKGKDIILEKGIYSGLGHWTNGNAELCLMGKKGSPKRRKKNIKQIVFEPRSYHSKKPHEVRVRIGKLVGHLERIELFARKDDYNDLKYMGWDVWGDEVENDIDIQ